MEAGSLDRVRSWSGSGDWGNRVSSLTAENVAWLESEQDVVSARRWRLSAEIGVWNHIEQSRSCAVDEMIVGSAFVVLPTPDA